MRCLLAAVLALCTGCDPGNPSVEPTDPTAQPGTTLLPLETTARLGVPDGGLARPTDEGGTDGAPPPPEPFDPFESLPPDRLPSTLAGLRLVLRWQPHALGAWPDGPEPSRELIRRLREETAGVWSVELASAGRMRAELKGRGQPLPRGTALLAHAEHYGTAFLWPNGSRFRPLPPGTVRNAMGDRRADMTPLATGAVSPRGEGERHGRRTRMLEITAPLATIEMEVASMELAARGGPLLCRLVLEIAGVNPASDACADGELLVSANVTWMARDAGEPLGIRLEVLEVQEEAELEGRRLGVPPALSSQVSTGLPGATGAVFLTDEELASLRPAGSADPKSDPDAPKEGIIAANRSDLLMLLVVDGVPLAAVPPWETMVIGALAPGRYSMKWLSFWGDTASPLTEVSVPGRVTYGVSSAETPDAG